MNTKLKEKMLKRAKEQQHIAIECEIEDGPPSEYYKNGFSDCHDILMPLLNEAIETLELTDEWMSNFAAYPQRVKITLTKIKKELEE